MDKCSLPYRNLPAIDDVAASVDWQTAVENKKHGFIVSTSNTNRSQNLFRVVFTQANGRRD